MAKIRKPIAGKGLLAIIADTSDVQAGAGLDLAAIRERVINELSKTHETDLLKTREETRAELTAEFDEALDEKEKEIIGLLKKLDEKQKLIDEEFPEGGAQELLIESYIQRATEFEQEENLLDAFYLCRKIIRLDPKNIKALYAVSAIYYSADLLEKSIKVLGFILEIDPAQERAKQSLAAIKRELYDAGISDI